MMFTKKEKVVFQRCRSQGEIASLGVKSFYKVNRCIARYSPRATTANQPTNRAPNEPARPGPK